MSARVWEKRKARDGNEGNSKCTLKTTHAPATHARYIGTLDFGYVLHTWTPSGLASIILKHGGTDVVKLDKVSGQVRCEQLTLSNC